MLVAGDVKLAQPLKKPLGDISTGAQSRLQDALGKLRARATASNTASGRVMGPYQDFALNQAGDQAGRGINDALYGALGGVSLDDVKNQQEFERQMALAKEIGDKMSPSVAEEILGGLSQGVNLASRGKGIYDSLGTSQRRRSSPATLDPYNVGYSTDEYYG